MSEIREMLNLVWAAAEQRTIACIMLYFLWAAMFSVGFAVCLFYARKAYLTQVTEGDKYHRNYWPCGILYTCAGVLGLLAIVMLLTGLLDALSTEYVTLANMVNLIHYATR